MLRNHQLKMRRDERGVVLILAIVVLVAMSLAAIALMRSSLTGNKVAGNLAFQQSATQSADVGVERAVSWLEQNRLGNTLWSDITGSNGTVGYLSSRADPPAGQSWAAWWSALSNSYKNPANVDASGNPTADAAGNTVWYVIQRLCLTPGDPTSNIGCQTAPTASAGAGTSQSVGPIVAGASVQYYYRITSRVDGVRGTVSFVQVVVAM